jgi:geranylgeranyl reductase family protein
VRSVEKFDAIVVGAGPAGSMAAYRLASEGVRVLLLDKTPFPRDKPCGGGISARALRELPVDPSPVVEHVVNRMELSFGGRRSFIRGGRNPLAYMTQRRRLDNFLVEQAVSAGADFRDGVEVGEVSERGVRVDGKWIDGELLIGADGVNGVTTRSLDLTDERIYAVALEGNLAHSDVNPERWQNTVLVELKTIPGGYCWVFPKGDHVNVGVGGEKAIGPTLRKQLKALCERRGLDHSKLQDLRGYRLPGRRAGAPLARGRALLIGDAAGLVDPLWGDGMFSAFRSARLAAEAGLDLLVGRTADLELYSRSVVSDLGPMIGFAWNAKTALDRFPRLAFSGLISGPGWRIVENLLLGETNERDVERGVVRVAFRGLEAWGRRAEWQAGTDYLIEADAPAELAPSSPKRRGAEDRRMAKAWRRRLGQ